MSAVTRRRSSSDCQSAFAKKSMSSFYLNPIVELDLKEEIQKLETEIMHLERNLLCRYRTAFRGQVASFDSPRLGGTPVKPKRRSLAEHLAGSKPDTLSSEIVKCVAAIYCKFATTQSRDSSQSSSSSSSASSSSSSASSTSSLSSVLSSNDASGSPDAMIRVLNIRLDDAHTFNYAAAMLHKFRSLVRNLEKVDPRKMNHEEKLAFWINIHNALLMHAYLAYGGGNSASKRESVFKASYNIGGIHINAQEIQSSILGIRPRNSSTSSSSSSPAWLQTLIHRRSPAGRHEYALDRPEPLVHFALAYGAFGDPPVRSYAARSLFGDLKVAKQEFIKASVEIVGHNKHKGVAKVLVPRLVYCFVKDVSMNGDGINVKGILEEELVNVGTNGCRFIQIRWLPNCCTFGYLIHPNVAI